MAIKAKVIATGEIVDVYCYDGKWVNMQNREEVYHPWEIDINYDEGKPYTPDYWTHLEHQYAGMAMQSLLLMGTTKEDAVKTANDIAHALVEKLKKKEESK